MKKFSVLLLALLVLFTTVTRPIYAAEQVQEGFELIPYSQNFAGDVIALVDADGHIIEVRPSDASPYSAAAGVLTISSAGGAMGVGSAAITSAALPVLAYILAAGVVILSVYALAEVTMTMYHSLSADAKAELDSLAESGADSYSLADTPHLFAELTALHDEIFYNDDGTFIDSGITFDPTNMLEYDFDTQYVHGNDLTASSYKYALSSNPIPIAGTSLSIALQKAPLSFPDEINKAFRLINSATGAECIFMPDVNTEFLDKSCCTYRITAPVVSTYSNYDGLTYHRLGFWVLAECGLIAAGESCSDCYARYTSQHYREGEMNATAGYYLFSKTGIAGLDDVLFRSQHRNAINTPATWDLYRSVPMDGVDRYSLPYSALQTICTDLTYSRTLTDTANPPAEDDTLYLPSPVVLDNANNLTQTGAQTGTWDVTIPDNPSIPDTDDLSFWEKLWMFLQGILDAILSIPSSIVDGIKAVLEYLFVPDLTGAQELVDLYTAKFGWVQDIFIYIRDLFNGLMADEPPKIPIHLENAESEYDWGDETYALDMTWYERYKPSVDTILSGILWAFFIWRIFQRIPDILSGAGLITDQVDAGSGHVVKDRAARRERRKH